MHILNTIFNQKLRTKEKFNIFLLFFVCFLSITSLFLFIDSKQSKLSGSEQLVMECIDNQHYQTDDCVELSQLISEELKNKITEKSKSLDKMEEELQAKQKLLNEMEQRNRHDFGYEYLHGYEDEHKGEYKIY